MKQITFQAFLNGVQLNHQINSAKLFLSKAHGIINYFPFREFPNMSNAEIYLTIGSDVDEKGVRNLSTFKIWDFAVGDEFHKENSVTYIFGDDCCTLDPTLTIEKIIDRTFVGDHLTYIRTTDTYYSRYLRDSLIERTITSNQIDSFDIYVDLQWEGVSGERVFVTEEATMSAYQNINNDNGLLNGLSYKYGRGDYYYYKKGCWQQIIVDRLCGYDHFYEGIGSIPFDCFNPWEGTDTDAQLVFFKKDSIELGTPLVFTTSTISTSSDKQVVLYPNPASEEITIKLEQNNFLDASFEIRNIHGQLLIKKENVNSEEKIDISSIQPGIYFVVILFSDQTSIAKRFIKN